VKRMFGRAQDYKGLLRLLHAGGDNAQAATALLAELMREWPEHAERRRELVDLEHEGDRITHDIVHHLYRKAATPFDRSDLLALASGLDDVVDYTEEVADFLGLYHVEAPMDQAIELSAVLAEAGRELALALRALDDGDRMRPHILAVDRLEDDGDRIERNALTALFEQGTDPMVVIRWKDIFERLEQAIDSCDRVAHLLEGIAVKRA
jgi:uncharacterized protein